MTKHDQRRSFGQITRLPSGRYRARYVGPDQVRHSAPQTFEDHDTAVLWLRKERRLIEETPEAWEPPKRRVARSRTRLTFEAYADTWLQRRNLKPRTRAHYRSLLDTHLMPTFGALPLAKLNADDVTAWHARMGGDRPTLRAHCYGLLRSIMASAVQDRHADFNPVHIRGAGNSKRVHKIRPVTLEDLEVLVTAMPER